MEENSRTLELEENFPPFLFGCLNYQKTILDKAREQHLTKHALAPNGNLGLKYRCENVSRAYKLVRLGLFIYLFFKLIN